MSDIGLHDLSRCYGRSFTSCELVVPALSRTYRLVADDGIFYLRLYRPIGRSPAEIAFEIRLQREVRPTPGLDVAQPIRTVDDADCACLSFEGVNRTAGLFQALDGRPIANEPADVALFGSALAKLHGALAEIDGGDVRPLDPVPLCARSLVSLTKIPNSATIRRAVERCRAEMLADPTMQGLPSGNCHGDARLANAVIRDGSVGFFDFDDCGYGPYLIDLGTAVWHFAVGEPSRTEALIAAILEGYEKERPLSPAERRALPHFVRLAQIRALLFLAEFCVLERDLWEAVFGRATNLLERDLTI
jgi:Ser/Thr protein kinase RdoA (MazF antagonist)